LRRTYKKMKGYGEALQYSVFLCELSPKERTIMMAELDEIINHDEDCIMTVDLGGIDRDMETKISFLGISKEMPGRQTLII
jgi:CRISPR-associated protein Cas2